MGIPIIGDLIEAAGKVVSEVVVDKDKRDQVNLELARLGDEAQARLDGLLQGQIEVNKIEASSGSVFVAGWRPAVGWVGAVALGYQAILYPFFQFIARVLSYKGDLPVLDYTLTMQILLGMLGLGAMRSYEKVKGVSTNNYTDVPKTPLETKTNVEPKGEAAGSSLNEAVKPRKKHFHIF